MLAFYYSIATQTQQSRFETLFHHYKNLMMYIARDITKNDHLAEDAVQDALVKVLLHIDDIGDIKSQQTKGWIIVITKRAVYDKMKYESRRTHENSDILDLMPEARDGLENKVIQNLTLEQVKNGLKKMDPHAFEMIMLRYYCGYTDTKLAKHFSISPELVRKRCERARKRLLIEMGQ